MNYKVKIIKSPPSPCWYNGLEGYEFDVYDNKRDFILIEDYMKHTAWRHINKEDVEILNESIE